MVVFDHPASPPAAPWVDLDVRKPETGIMSYFYGDPLSALPVRHVTRRNDNKSDPNVETGTYGLFSVCELEMRATVAKEGIPHIFFVSKKHDGERYLAGRYRVGWYARGKDFQGNRKKARPDYALAASEVRFLRHPIPMAEVAKRLRDPFFGKWFRLYKYKEMTPERTRKLLAFINRFDDSTNDVIAETHRLEMVNMRFHQARYPSWGRKSKWDWDSAAPFLNPAKTVAATLVNSSVPKGEKDWWVCYNCSKAVKSKAPLKICPACESIGTLQPV